MKPNYHTMNEIWDMAVRSWTPLIGKMRLLLRESETVGQEGKMREKIVRFAAWLDDVLHLCEEHLPDIIVNAHWRYRLCRWREENDT